MPTYEYQCDACGHNFDEFQSITEEPLKTCPSCKKKKLRRVFGTGGAIIFKGSGFYQTDYRSESYKSAAKADKDSSSGSKSESKSDTKSDSKPADSKGSSKSSSKSE